MIINEDRLAQFGIPESNESSEEIKETIEGINLEESQQSSDDSVSASVSECDEDSMHLVRRNTNRA